MELQVRKENNTEEKRIILKERRGKKGKEKRKIQVNVNRELY